MTRREARIGKKYINNSSKYIGVHINGNHERGNWKKFQVVISLPIVGRKFIGIFDDEREAALAYDYVAIKYGMPTNILKRKAA